MKTKSKTVMTQKVVVIYSGGMDSFTVLNKALQQGHEVYALSFDYGQRHVKELKVAANVCEKLGVSHKIVDISAINQLIGGSSLTDDIDVPEGHYEAENMKSTIVPNRNMILLSLAVGYAVSLKASQVYYGAHSGDHAIYPDCRPEFVQKMDDVCRIANYDAVEIFSPYLNDTKIDILTDGIKMGLDYSQTWTCYNGREKACGKCGACQERLEAFSLNNITDPIEYE
ncbi:MULTISPECIES: 7-cyano-7-deazaguanine synthase QueC [Pseudoalteromonas]|uniref:7-cyano-7-deazaguanine synthase n=2 Tax=Pseudoalteromonas TaxID=53246 RepID=A0ABU1BGJ9_PSEHA|nr:MULTISPECIES: 7-cyano-7-deazaguanine synthase QueC [Pseudoalteromonas]MDQ9093485.1 7-cyano-7-deazaguanine synthase QueC [Pseudoalteromonas haloplanktis]